MRNLGLDMGDKRIGVALSDPDGILASPLTIISRTALEADIQAILNIISSYRVSQVIIGLPLAMDGSISRQAEKVTAFAEELQVCTDIPIDLRDERLTTVSAKRMMQGVRKVGKASHDAIAAAVILQAFLDEAEASQEQCL